MAPSSHEPPPPRPKRSLLGRLVTHLKEVRQNPRKKKGPDTPRLAAGVASSLTPAVAITEVKRYAYVRWLLRVLTASVILNGAVITILFLAGLIAGQRPTLQLNAAPSLRAEADAVFGKNTEVNVDDLLLYVNTVLPLMHRVDDRGSPELPLLRGLVAPAVYDQAEAEARRGAPLAKKNYVIQNLVVTRVDDVVTDTERGRLSAYVRGYLAIIVQSTSKPVVLPYRAEVLLEKAPPGRLNRFPFVLIRRDWRIDKAATGWDESRAALAALAAQKSTKTK